MHSFSFGSNFEHTTIGSSEHRFIEIFETFFCFFYLFVNFFILFRQKLFNKYISAVTFFRIFIVNQRVAKCIHVTTCLPGSRVHQNSRIEAHNVFMHLHHGLPPVFLDIVFQQCAVWTVIVNSTQSIINFRTLEYITILLSMAYHFFKLFCVVGNHGAKVRDKG